MMNKSLINSFTTINDVMLSLGGFKFSITTAAYQELTKKHDWTWAGIKRFGQTETLHFTGEGNQTISLNGTIYSEFENVGPDQLNALEQLGKQATPLLLVSGLGKVWGYFVITSLSETQSAFLQHGVVKKQNFSLELKYYGQSI